MIFWRILFRNLSILNRKISLAIYKTICSFLKWLLKNGITVYIISWTQINSLDKICIYKSLPSIVQIISQDLSSIIINICYYNLFLYSLGFETKVLRSLDERWDLRPTEKTGGTSYMRWAWWCPLCIRPTHLSRIPDINKLWNKHARVSINQVAK
jgi:hypothetical protein